LPYFQRARARGKNILGGLVDLFFRALAGAARAM
jgi:hypothetical protein